MSQAENKVIPEGYKQTEIGVIPEDWQVAEIVDISSKVTDGTHDTPSPVREGVPFLTAIHIKENNIAFESCYYLPKSIHDEIYRRCNPEFEDVLMVNIGAGTGTTALVTVDYPFSLKNVALIKPNKLRTDGRYLNQVLSFQKNNILDSLSAGGAQPFLSLSQISQIKISTPCKKEQTAIANALSDVDALLSELEKLIAKKQAMKTATMQQLLTGKNRLPQFAFYSDINSIEGAVEGKRKGTKPSELGEIPDDWEVVNLGEIISFKNGAAHEDCVDEYGNFVLVNSKFVSTEGRVRKGASECRQAASNNDLLMVMSDVPNGKAIAKCFLVDQDNLYTVNQRICILKPLDEMNPIFLLKVLSRNPYYLAFDDGAKQTNLRRQDVLSCPLVKPPKEEQTAIATILSDMDNEIQTLEQRLSKTRQIKQGMMQELLTGKTRLPFGKDITSEVSV
ncbi:restriction endonuclease subunit S [Shewanella baltica]|uniref:restriction endonuclease subunit S n=1 Tax=Shewanella baltica TaxID=62322 RepID=UPI003D7A5C96